jgi:hypothetical protein
MSAEVKHLNPSEYSRADLDRLAFALMGHMQHFFVVERPMSRKEAMDYLGVSDATFCKLVNTGVVKRHLLEGLSTPFFLPSELHKLIKNS